MDANLNWPMASVAKFDILSSIGCQHISAWKTPGSLLTVHHWLNRRLSLPTGKRIVVGPRSVVTTRSTYSWARVRSQPQTGRRVDQRFFAICTCLGTYKVQPSTSQRPNPMLLWFLNKVWYKTSEFSGRTLPARFWHHIPNFRRNELRRESKVRSW